MKRGGKHISDIRPDRIATFTNDKAEERQLLEFVASKMPEAKRGDLKTWLKHGHMRVDGIVHTGFDTPVGEGTMVEVNFTRPFVVFRHRRLELVYEDDDIIVVNKGYGLLSVGTGSEKSANVETAYSILKDYVKRKHPMNKIFVVHRLDRHTSGLMLFAKHPEAQQAMQHNWNNMVLERKYVAVVEGVPEEDSGVIRSRLAETSAYEVYSSRNGEEGKEATTRYKVLQRGKGFSLLEFSLDTGRKNQIRVHARDLGYPIEGDRKYGARTSRLRRLALHARTLRFAHPMTRKDMNFESPTPGKFIGLVRSGS